MVCVSSPRSLLHRFLFFGGLRVSSRKEAAFDSLRASSSSRQQVKPSAATQTAVMLSLTAPWGGDEALAWTRPRLQTPSLSHFLSSQTRFLMGFLSAAVRGTRHPKL